MPVPARRRASARGPPGGAPSGRLSSTGVPRAPAASASKSPAPWPRRGRSTGSGQVSRARAARCGDGPGRRPGAAAPAASQRPVRWPPTRCSPPTTTTSAVPRSRRASAVAGQLPGRGQQDRCAPAAPAASASANPSPSASSAVGRRPPGRRPRPSPPGPPPTRTTCAPPRASAASTAGDTAAGPADQDHPGGKQPGQLGGGGRGHAVALDQEHRAPGCGGEGRGGQRVGEGPRRSRPDRANWAGNDAADSAAAVAKRSAPASRWARTRGRRPPAAGARRAPSSTKAIGSTRRSARARALADVGRGPGVVGQPQRPVHPEEQVG